MIPTIQNLRTAQTIYKKVPSWEKVDTLLYDTFLKYPKNDCHDTVVFKTELIDSLYNCNLMMDKTEVADHILAKKLDLQNGDIVENINKIAEIKLISSNKRVGWVFATKYCHFHFPKRYPIYDKFAKMAVKYLTGKSYVYLEKFDNYKKEVDNLISTIGGDTDYKQMDIYLYLFGQWIEKKSTKKKKDISLLVQRVMNNDEQLFEQLRP